MKNIAVLFDFSDASRHAVLYALCLAKKLKVQIQIFNMVFVDSKQQQSESRVLAGHNHYDNEVPLNNAFQNYATEVRTLSERQNLPNDFQPGVSFYESGNDLVELMCNILKDRQMVMLITAPFQAKTIADFVLSENCRSLLDWSTIPVLIVPESAPVRHIEKIAFCTSLATTEADYLNDITKLLNPLSSEVMVAHLNGPENCISKFITENLFKASITAKVDYGRVYYRDIPFKHCGKGWLWLKANKICDLLVMIQQPQSLMKLFFALEQTAFISYDLPIPLLIIPETH